MYNLNYTPTTLVVQSWREIISGGTRTKRVEYLWSRLTDPICCHIITEGSQRGNYQQQLNFNATVAAFNVTCNMELIWSHCGNGSSTPLRQLSCSVCFGCVAAELPLRVAPVWRLPSCVWGMSRFLSMSSNFSDPFRHRNLPHAGEWKGDKREKRKQTITRKTHFNFYIFRIR
jgi:hypothetical protein